LKCPDAISFTKACLQVDPTKRSTAIELLRHEYFEDFHDWFDEEIQELVKYDKTENERDALHNLSGMKSQKGGMVQLTRPQSSSLSNFIHTVQQATTDFTKVETE